jgi:hypothetical protein
MKYFSALDVGLSYCDILKLTILLITSTAGCGLSPPYEQMKVHNVIEKMTTILE